MKIRLTSPCHCSKSRDVTEGNELTSFKRNVGPNCVTRRASGTAWPDRITVAVRRAYATLRACAPDRDFRFRRNPDAEVSSIAFASVQAAIADATYARECVAELEKVELRYSMLASPQFPSVRARIELIGVRVLKARNHARFARAHADIAMLIYLSGGECKPSTRLRCIKHHADLAREAHLFACDLFEISLERERRERSRYSWPGPTR